MSDCERREFWKACCIAAIRSGRCKFDDAPPRWADESLKVFDKRFSEDVNEDKPKPDPSRPPRTEPLKESR